MESAFAILAEPNRRALLSLLATSERSVGELEFQLACGEERVDVHTGVARAQHGGHGHGELRHVGQHDGHARAGLQPLALQPGAQGGGMAVQLAIAHPALHAHREGAGGMLAHRLFQQVRGRAVLIGVHVVRYARGVVLEPDLVHALFCSQEGEKRSPHSLCCSAQGLPGKS